jgi:hypothetical protein
VRKLLSWARTGAQVAKVASFIMSSTLCKPINRVKEEYRQSVRTSFQTLFATDRHRREDCKRWQSWSTQYFCKCLLAAVPDNATSQHIVGFNEAVAKVQINFDLANPSVEKKTDKLHADIGDTYPDATADMQLKACKTCISKLPSEPVNYQQIIYRPLDMTPRLIT